MLAMPTPSRHRLGFVLTAATGVSCILLAVAGQWISSSASERPTVDTLATSDSFTDAADRRVVDLLHGTRSAGLADPETSPAQNREAGKTLERTSSSRAPEGAPPPLVDRQRSLTLALRSAKHGGSIGGASVSVLCAEVGDLIELRADASGNVSVPESAAIHYYVSAPDHLPTSLTPQGHSERHPVGGGTTVVQLTPYAEVSGALDPERFSGGFVSLHVPDSHDGSPPYRTAVVTDLGTWCVDRLVGPSAADATSKDSLSPIRYRIEVTMGGYSRTMFPEIEVPMGEEVHLDDPFGADISAHLKLVYPSGRIPTTELPVVLTCLENGAGESLEAKTDESASLRLPAIRAGRWSCSVKGSDPYEVEWKEGATTTLVLKGFDRIDGQVKLREAGSGETSTLGRLAMVSLTGAADAASGAVRHLGRSTTQGGRFAFDMIPEHADLELVASMPSRRDAAKSPPAQVRSGDVGITLWLDVPPEEESSTLFAPFPRTSR
ncbi:MAG: hypothetical protein AAGG01_14295 [Planctomycetota bacterium]